MSNAKPEHAGAEDTLQTMSNRYDPPPDSQPNDLVGKDGTGRVRIDRVIPLPWALGIIAVGIGSIAQQYFGLQQVIASVTELKTEFRTQAQDRQAAQIMLREHTLQIADHERRMVDHDRRLSKLEDRK